MSPSVLTRKQVWSDSWPLVFANGLVPMVGVVDTMVIGLAGNATDLAGVALGAAVFAIFYWGVYSLRQSTTGLVAQALGAKDITESQLILVRAALLGFALGALIFLFKQPVQDMAFFVLQGSDAAENIGREYVSWRFVGAPAAIALFAITGWMIGAGLPRLAMIVQIVLALSNTVLDIWLVMGLGLGAKGVAAGTSIAEWLTLILAILLLLRHISRTDGIRYEALSLTNIFHFASFVRLLVVSGDLFIRSMCMVVGFTWFINSGAKQGDALLAGNQILLQFITLWAFVLDAFAFTAEAQTGRAMGKKSWPDLKRAVRITSEFALVCALICSLFTFVLGPLVLQSLIRDPFALSAALEFLPWCAMVPLIGVAAWQLDGIFVGATRSKAMRNSAIVSVLFYLALDFWLSPLFGNHGVWAAFLGYYLARGVSLAMAWPSLARQFSNG